MSSRLAAFTGLFAIAVLSMGLASTISVQARDDASKPAYYTAKVKPILDAHCAECHGGTKHRGGLNMDTRESLLKGGRDGIVVIPGDPANSALVKYIRHEGPQDDPKDMPPNKPRLSDADIDTITQWIKAGAVMPAATTP